MSKFHFNAVSFCLGLALLLGLVSNPARAQQVLGAITGTIKDSSGASVPGAAVKARNTSTNLQVSVETQSNGFYSIPNLPIGAYELSFSKSGFETETHPEVLVQGDRTTTVDGNLRVGATTTTVEVVGTPLMNQVDTTNGYVVDQLTIQETPLGTGSFTQLAILAPGVHADFLAGAGSNAGLGNQAIFANGQRDTSNSFSLNGISTNNLFNGNSTSQVGENRFVLNTGENFGAGGEIQTSTSVYGAIGQALPTPPPEAIQEISVNAAMYDATQGANSGAHIGVITKSGTNQIHGQIYEKFQNSAMNAAPFFYNASPAITTKVPFMNRNQFGATLGGPIKKDKLFYFLSYQGVRIADATDATKDATVPLGLTNDRSAQGIVNAVNSSGFGTTITASQISPVAAALLNAKLKNGQYLIPSAQITNPLQATGLGYDAVLQGPNAIANVDQGIANIDFVASEKDRLTGKYYVQVNPTTNPFGAVGSLLGFPQQLSAGSQVGSIENTVILSPALTWEQRVGFTRLHAYSQTSQALSPSDVGMNLLGSNTFPQMEIDTSDPTIAAGLEFGPSTSFGNAGMFQNQWEYGTRVGWVKGRHTLSFGAQWDHTQLNIINKNTSTDIVEFTDFSTFVQGSVRSGQAFAGSASRYYRSDTVGAFINDNYKIRSNLTLTLGLRWDYDGPLTEKYGRLTAFNSNLYAYDAATDTITASGLEFAKNGSDSLIRKLQGGFAPRVAIAWTPLSKLTIRTGFGIYYDRGEFFSYLSPSAGKGFNGPFGVTLAPPFVEPIAAKRGASSSVPFGTVAPTPPPGTPAQFLSSLPNLAQTESGNWPAGNLFGPFAFGGYDINNKLPYSENWTFDLQYQAANNWLFSAGYIGNHGVHQVLPVPFNQPLIATPQNPVNGQIYSYGGLSPLSVCNFPTAPPLDLEPLCPPPYYAGNAEVRVPYIGYDMNSVLYKAEGISNYNALQLQARKRLSFGLQFTASYTYSHALDEQSGLGLFFTGNNPLNPKSNYASADFDQTHVFLINYSYTIPSLTSNKLLGEFVNGWTVGGQTVAQSGQPYSVYDYSGSVAGLYYGTYDEITNPIVPLKPGVSAKQAQLQGTTGINAGLPVLNANDFLPQFVAPGTFGVPPCDATGCDLYESLYGTSGRNLFRGPFQVRFDMSVAKEFSITERARLRFEADAFNIFNHPDFDTPNNDVTFFPFFSGPPLIPPQGSLGIIQHTIGSPRFLQLNLHLTF
ncbi:MAG: carboxypeptidase regulatory-like domain-containing protein [Acidobacteriaceae bacterium]|nr:carboxypeptidase regulatory-like domain-containing protein [Acidobacteriaceae bacterium]MBV9781254.1 carboxypeptidase regulatory-like domain-containing protein [Acidobacteriaceae bacterium]